MLENHALDIISAPFFAFSVSQNLYFQRIPCFLFSMLFWATVAFSVHQNIDFRWIPRSFVFLPFSCGSLFCTTVHVLCILLRKHFLHDGSRLVYWHPPRRVRRDAPAGVGPSVSWVFTAIHGSRSPDPSLLTNSDSTTFWRIILMLTP